MPARTDQRILVIDHDARVNEALRLLLTDAGYKALAAPDLDAAVHLLSSMKFDLVITNYMEPAFRRGNRWPVLEMIRLLVDPGTPTIVLTTSPQEMSQTAGDLGVADILAKPFELDDLIERVAAAIEGRSRYRRESRTFPRARS